MNSKFMMIFVLTLVCLVSAFALAVVNDITAGPIARQKKLAEARSVSAALPKSVLKYDNDPSSDIVTVPEWKSPDGSPMKVYVARRNGKIVGVAFVVSGQGYSGKITSMLGVDMEQNITGLAILEEGETPGLGANIENCKLFRCQFKGKSAKSTTDGKLVLVKGRKPQKAWEIQAITGATISSTGVLKGVNEGLVNLRKYSKEILNLGNSKGGTK